MTIDELCSDALVALNRFIIQDGNGANITDVFMPRYVNMAIHYLEQRLVGPQVSYTWSFQTVAMQQTYPMQETPLPVGVGEYRATESITIPWQQATFKWGAGLRLNYLPHAKARAKYQLGPAQVAPPVPSVPGSGQPTDYSIWDDPAAGIFPAYWFWPPPDGIYTFVVDQKRFLADLVTGQSPQQDNWYTRIVPDLVLWQAVLMAGRILGDATKAPRYQQNRDEAWQAALGLANQAAFDEQGAGMVEPG